MKQTKQPHHKVCKQDWLWQYRSQAQTLFVWIVLMGPRGLGQERVWQLNRWKQIHKLLVIVCSIGKEECVGGEQADAADIAQVRQCLSAKKTGNCKKLSGVRLSEALTFVSKEGWVPRQLGDVYNTAAEPGRWDELAFILPSGLSQTTLTDKKSNLCTWKTYEIQCQVHGHFLADWSFWPIRNVWPSLLQASLGVQKSGDSTGDPTLCDLARTACSHSASTKIDQPHDVFNKVVLLWLVSRGVRDLNCCTERPRVNTRN